MPLPLLAGTGPRLAEMDQIYGFRITVLMTLIAWKNGSRKFSFKSL